MAQRVSIIRPWAYALLLLASMALAAWRAAAAVPGPTPVSSKAVSEQLTRALPVLAPGFKNGKLIGIALQDEDDAVRLLALVCEPKPEAARPCQLLHFDIMPLQRSPEQQHGDHGTENQSLAGAASIVAWPTNRPLETSLPEALARLWCRGLSINHERPVVEDDAVSRALRQLGGQRCPAALSAIDAGPALALASGMPPRMRGGCLLLPRLEQNMTAVAAAGGVYSGKIQPGLHSWHWREDKAGRLQALWTVSEACGDSPQDAFAAQGFAKETPQEGDKQPWRVAAEGPLTACTSYSLAMPRHEAQAATTENMELWARLLSEPQRLADELAPLANKASADPLLRLVYTLALDRADRPEALAAYAALLQIPKAPDIAGMPWPALLRLSRATLLLERGALQEALADAEYAFRAMPWNSAAAYWLGAAYKLSGQPAPALRTWQLAVGLLAAGRQLDNWLVGLHNQRGASVRDLLEPEPAKVYNDLAWLLATARDAKLRQGTEAVRLAERALELAADDSAALFDTLAAAHAAAGSFELAVNTSKKAIELAPQADREAIEKHLAAFQRREIWVE